MTRRHRTWEIVEVARSGDRTSRAFDVIILNLIALNVIAVVVGSVHVIREKYGAFLDWFEWFSVFVFTVEYLLRVWSCVEEHQGRNGLTTRLHFMTRPLPVIDIIAIVPTYLAFVGLDLRVVRILRLVRIIRLAKLARYSASLRLFGKVFRDRREELILTVCVMAMLLVIASCLMFYCEREAQPDAFPDIPGTMWWTVVTLTTVGYGDVYPVTSLGKMVAAGVAMIGIALFALPAGIIGSGFVEEIQNRKKATKCPHCGKEP